MARSPHRRDDKASGLITRQIVTTWLTQIISQKRSLDDVLLEAEGLAAWRALEARDKGFARTMIMAVLRHKGEIDWLLAKYLQKPPPRRSQVHEILSIAAAQILFLDVAAYAAIDLAVRQAKSSDRSRHLAKLVNAVLRRLSETGPAVLKEEDASLSLNIPTSLMDRWVKAYGLDTARLIGAASLEPAALDLAASGDAITLASMVGGVPLAPGNGVRLLHKGAVPDLAGFAEGAWWVQDFAAQLPTLLFGDLTNKSVLDLCAAPGGKTASLIRAGAKVMALDSSPKRLERVRANLVRLNYKAEVVEADLFKYQPDDLYDAVLLDAPCSSTGTVRRHPDILHLKTVGQIKELAALQARMLEQATGFLKPGGLLIYCTCSLEAEEGELQIEQFLEGRDDVKRVPIEPLEIELPPGWITDAGDVRLLPHYSPRSEPPLEAPLQGMDGFFISRLRLQPSAT